MVIEGTLHSSLHVLGEENKGEVINSSNDEKAKLLECLRQYGEVSWWFERKIDEMESARINELSSYRREILLNLLEENVWLKSELSKSAIDDKNIGFLWERFTEREYEILKGRGQDYGIHRIRIGNEYKLVVVYNGCYISLDDLWNKLSKDDKKWREDRKKREKKVQELLNEHGWKRNCGNCRKSVCAPSWNEWCYEDDFPHNEEDSCWKHKFYWEDDY